MRLGGDTKEEEDAVCCLNAVDLNSTKCLLHRLAVLHFQCPAILQSFDMPGISITKYDTALHNEDLAVTLVLRDALLWEKNRKRLNL